MHTGRVTAVYAAGHFIVDLACAFVLIRFARPAAAWATAALLYNFFAFAGQMPLGLLADRFGNGRMFAAVGCLLVSAAYVMPDAPLLLAVTAGVGNALYHIGGGFDVLRTGDRAGLLGVFVSPGAFGLFLGVLLARSPFPPYIPPLLLLAAAAAVLRLCGRTDGAGPSFRLTGAGILALAALFLVVCLRSYTGFLFAFPWKTGAWAWVFVLCVVLGKAAGGFLYDRFGGVRTAAVTLGCAAALFLVSANNPVFGCAAVLLFNMTMPVTLRAAADRLPGARGFSFGLLTFALFLGFLPEYMGLPALRTVWMYAALCVLSLALLLAGLRREADG
jgi:FSR family fosmidomycin resistance protein-like MFS transporter